MEPHPKESESLPAEARAKLGRLDSLLGQLFEAMQSVPASEMHAAWLAEAKANRLPDEVSIPLEIFELRDALGAETDRGCALLAASYLEGELETLLRGFFIDDPQTADDLLGPSRPIGSFSARIDLAFSLGLVPPRAQRDLHLIRRIRNDFGHQTKVSFQDAPIIARCSEFYHDIYDAADVPPRRRFMRVVIGLAAIIHGGARLNPRRHQAKDVEIAEAARLAGGDALVKAVVERLRRTGVTS